MALIKCPECGKEISDKAISCPSCGCPINTLNVNGGNVPEQDKTEKVESKKQNTDTKKVLPIILVVIAVIIIGIIVYYFSVIQPKKIEERNKANYEEAIKLIESGKYDEAALLLNEETYDEVVNSVNKEKYEKAIDLLENGKYGEANDIFNTILDFEDVITIKDQLYYESRLFQCIKLIKERLKNPDSLQIYDVVFFGKEYNDNIVTSDSAIEAVKNVIDQLGDEPTVLMNYGAQNGFGGTTTSYAIFVYLNDKYLFLGSCNTLDEEKVSKDDKQTCEIINIIMKCFKTIGNIDIDRVKQVLKNDNYTSIDIVE